MSDRTRTQATSRRRAVVLVGLAALLTTVLSAGPASAHDSHGWVWIGTDRLVNWDAKSKSWNWDKRDWPVNIIFWNNASVRRVERGGAGPDPQGQSDDHRLDDDVFKYDCNVFDWCNMNIAYDNSGREAAGNGPFRWTEEGGRKEFRCGYSSGADQWSLHYRVYGEYGNTFWNPYWGFWVPMTTHFDIDDPNLPFSDCDATAHGYDETAEGWLIYYYGRHSSGPGWDYIEDWMHLHNSSDYRIQDGREHYGNGDGMLSIMYVP